MTVSLEFDEDVAFIVIDDGNKNVINRTFLDELGRRDGRYALIAMCCGGGLGTGTVIERL